MDWTLTRLNYDDYELCVMPAGEPPIKLGNFNSYPTFAEITKALDSYQHEEALYNLKQRL